MEIFSNKYVARQFEFTVEDVDKFFTGNGHQPVMTIDGVPHYSKESLKFLSDRIEDEKYLKQEREGAPAAIELYNAAADKLEAAIIKVKAEFLDLAAQIGIPTETALQLYQREAGSYPHAFERKEFPKYAEHGASYIGEHAKHLAAQEQFVLEDAHRTKTPLIIIQGGIENAGYTVSEAIVRESEIEAERKAKHEAWKDEYLKTRFPQ